ncbi:SigE family RNA polymerase sigma factor [Nocardioides marmoriginsengisoli]|uniref:SigE family RNA polymerase sigma factor n=1 Tax=Nocardioides marmoriginsengisoli TaxID=661483 RepID=UPI00319DD436
MVRANQRDAEFVAFVSTRRQDLVRTAVLLCAGDEATAEDLVQTTLTRLYLSWARVRRADSPIAYARASLTNAFVDEMRRAHRRRESTLADPTVLLVREEGARAPDPDLQRLVLAALAELGPRQRAVVVLRHWHDLDTAETARILGCSVGTVKSQNARALARLRQVLGTVQQDLLVGLG